MIVPFSEIRSRGIIKPYVKNLEPNGLPHGEQPGRYVVRAAHDCILRQGCTDLVETVEQIGLPEDMMCLVFPLREHQRVGINVSATILPPGTTEHILLAVAYYATIDKLQTLVIGRDSPLAHLVFLRIG